eukprot:CAMPEP_0119335188 /NCGR_PEP_ID=MMETSP1333-20130426/88949_1 /TAXON_ID=418940 /ORGANISM="Scyphosphaera apsteinii, Strain RCC1455" /LENGTH=69 /DNA_ID=CAMNT_0007345671 /DNA_START=37 /DNA_END=246 /DNA_ORIENTATION=-
MQVARADGVHDIGAWAHELGGGKAVRHKHGMQQPRHDELHLRLGAEVWQEWRQGQQPVNEHVLIRGRLS